MEKKTWLSILVVSIIVAGSLLIGVTTGLALSHKAEEERQRQRLALLLLQQQQQQTDDGDTSATTTTTTTSVPLI